MCIIILYFLLYFFWKRDLKSISLNIPHKYLSFYLHFYFKLKISNIYVYIIIYIQILFLNIVNPLLPEFFLS